LKISTVADSEEIKHTSPLIFFSSLLAGELAGCVVFVASLTVPLQIVSTLDEQEQDQQVNVCNSQLA